MTHPLHHALDAFERASQTRVLVVAANWRGDRAVDLDEDALHLVDELMRARAESGAPLCVWCVGRGGRLGFADGMRRRLPKDAIACVPDVTRGALTLVALGATRLELGLAAGLGAYDSGTLGRLPGVWSLQTLPYVDRPLMAQLDPEHASRVVLKLAQDASRRAQARACAHLMVNPQVADALSADALGDELALGTSALSQLGLQATRTPQWREAFDDLWDAICEHLGLRDSVESRAQQDVLMGEIEFDLTSTYPGALLAMAHKSWTLQLDAGLPDPDSGMLKGQWSEYVPE